MSTRLRRLADWLAWRSLRPNPFKYAGDWNRFRRDLERWELQKP